MLIAGVSGVVGYGVAQAFAADPDWEVIGISRRAPAHLGRVRHLPLDLADAQACADAVSGLSEVTHVVYAALFEQPGLVPGWFDPVQMQTNLAYFSNLMEPLCEKASKLSQVTLLQGTKAYGAHVERLAVPARERDGRHRHENFYWLQHDDLLARQARSNGWSWTILRPQIVFGEALGSNMNPIPALGVYGALLRARGEPLHYPGGAPWITEAVDASLLGEAARWAATSPAAADQIFNVTNGDVFSLANVWPAIATALGMEPGEHRPCSLADTVAAQADRWAELVHRFDLRAPVDLGAFVGQSLIYVDLISGFGRTGPIAPTLVSTTKIRQAGFGACCDTEQMLDRLIRRFQDLSLFPPRDWRTPHG